MNVFGSTESKSSSIFQNVRQAQNSGVNFGQLVSENSEDSSKKTGPSAGVSQSRALSTSFAAYNAAGQVTGATRSGGGSAAIDLSADLRQAKADGKEVSEETLGKLLSRGTSTFVEGVSEATGRTPAQVMTALLNMNGTQAADFCRSLEELTGVSAESFMPMVSSLTGQPEALLQQCLNGQEDEEEEETGEQDKLNEAKTLDYQRDFFQAAEYKSIDVMV